MNYLRKKLKPYGKLLHKVFKEEYGYDLLPNISPFATLFHTYNVFNMTGSYFNGLTFENI